MWRGPLVLLGRDCFGSRERGRGGRPRPSCQTRQLGLDTGSIRSIFCGRVRPTDFMLQWLSRPPIRLIPVVRGKAMQVEFEGWWWVTTNDAAMPRRGPGWARCHAERRA